MVSQTELVDSDGGSLPILMLSPLGVAPAAQGVGIGSRLTRAALAVADERAEPVMVVQGHPGYYPRFGFVRARTLGILPPEHLPTLDKAWMARPGPACSADIRGQVVYPPHFVELD
jgi:putative acetyltransferase